MSSSMENRPEPIHLYAQPKPGTEGPLHVVRSSGEMVVPETDSTNFVRDTIVALKMSGVDHRTHVVIHSVSSNPAWSGSIEQHHP
jgi:hypothetical protein